MSLTLRTLAAAGLVLCLSSCFLIPRKRMVDLDYPEVETASGVVWRELAMGRGEPAVDGDPIEIDYVCTLEDETRVDSSYERGTPVEFTLGQAPLAGWNEGCRGMKRGGKRWMLVPPALAYGEAGVPGLVPPNASLVFEVELVRVGAGDGSAHENGASSRSGDDDDD